MNKGIFIPALLAASIGSASAVDFHTQVKPVLEANCVACHKAGKTEGDLDMTTLADILKGGGSGDVLKPGDPDGSHLFKSMTLAADDDDLMPPAKKGGPLPKEIVGVVKEWIAEGAKWPEGVVLEQQARVDFVTDIQPILEFNCVSCHRAGNDEGGLILDNKKDAFTSGENGPDIIPFNAEKSAVHFLTVLDADDDDLMPPAKKGGPLAEEKTSLLRDWISQGAPWPDDVTLIARKATLAEAGSETEKVRLVYEHIMANHKAITPDEMKRYEGEIPGSDAYFDMVPIPAGEFVMGSPESEKGHKPDEGPQVKVKINPFWMGKTEVTWNEFELFMYPHQEKMIRELKKLDPEFNEMTDALARPTSPYVEMSFGMGKDGYPAISMTQHAANKYCEWLSAKTGQFYRLPTEAEWEYACRAGTTTAYYWGDDIEEIEDYAWYGMNSDWKYQKVGKKKPNAFGLYDMHGNVAEWVLDGYDAEFYAHNQNGLNNPWNEAKTEYNRVARGGSWDDDDPLVLRSAVRRVSNPMWKQQDPQLPKSIWYLTDAQFLGFRIVRPLTVPSAEEMEKIWNTNAKKD
jgi:formylglycine-generating enzyme required for sulfatase activity